MSTETTTTPQMPLHYWRIHKRVALRVLADVSPNTRHRIASEPTSDDAVWFGKKVHADAARLFEDADYYDNAQFTFKVSRIEASV